MAVAIAVAPTHGKGKQRAYDDVEEDEQMGQVVQGDEDVTLVLDPTRNEEQSSVARFCFGWAFGQEFSSVAPKDRGARGRSGEEEQDEEAECVYLESDGEFDAATVSLAVQLIISEYVDLISAYSLSSKRRTALHGLHVKL
jgi:hypothetical protein